MDEIVGERRHQLTYYVSSGTSVKAAATNAVEARVAAASEGKND